MNETSPTLSMSVMSGKGGVGKTNLSLSLGYAFHRAGSPLILMDCDLGLANLDVLLGLSPEKTLQDLLLPDVNIDDIVVGIEPGGLDFIPAASGVPELVDMDEDMQAMLFDKLTELLSKYQYLVLDLGAGISKTVLSMATMTHLRLVVITPEPTSLTDSYALIKVLNAQHGVEDFFVVVNQMSSVEEGQATFERLHMACRKFLNVDIRYLGGVHHDPAIPEAVRRQVPLLKLAPNCRASKDIIALAQRLHQFREESAGLLSMLPPLRHFPLPESE